MDIWFPSRDKSVFCQSHVHLSVRFFLFLSFLSFEIIKAHIKTERKRTNQRALFDQQGKINQKKKNERKIFFQRKVQEEEEEGERERDTEKGWRAVDGYSVIPFKANRRTGFIHDSFLMPVPHTHTHTYTHTQAALTMRCVAGC